MSDAATPTGGSAADWLALGPASRMLGVDPDTLRRWADDGRIPAYTTPGRHRRFRRADVERLCAARRPGTRRLSELGASEERLTRAYARTYRDAVDSPALDHLAEADRKALRNDGRRLVAVLLAYLDARTQAARDRWETEALDLIGETARRLSRVGATAPEVVTVYVRARRPLMGEIGALGRRRALEPTQLAALFEQAVGLLDRLLLHLVATHAAASDAGVPSIEPGTMQRDQRP